MDDLDGRIRDTLNAYAREAPSAESLLAVVHARSRRSLLRRRALGAVSAVAMVALVWTAVPPLAQHWRAHRGLAGPAVTPSLPSRTAGNTPSRSSPTGANATSHGLSLRFTAGDAATPYLPYRLDSTIARQMLAPVVTLTDGVFEAYYEAKDPVGGADITVVESASRPVFPHPAGPVTEVPRSLRGRHVIKVGDRGRHLRRCRSGS